MAKTATNERQNYPKRESHFAHKVVRKMIKTCAAQEMGATAFLLVCVVAHTEDAKRYTRFVTYYNEQLYPLLGINCWKALDKARRDAIDAGWLHYESPGRRKAGRYWSLIPDWAEALDDSPTDENPPEDCSTGGERNATETQLKRNSKATSEGELSSLTLSPSPSLAQWFDEFWKAYPKKVGKQETRSVFAKLSHDDRPEVVVALANYLASKRVQDGYLRDPVRFLRANFWRDWLEPELPSPESDNGDGVNHETPVRKPPTVAEIEARHAANRRP